MPPRRIAVRSFITTVLFILAIAHTAIAETHPPIRKSFNVSPGGRLTIDSDLGSIEIRSGAQSRVDVEVQRETRGRSDLDRFEVDMRQRGNEVEVRGEYDRGSLGWLDAGRLKVKYVVTVPEQFNVDLKTSGGSITVSSLTGAVDARTSGGSIHAGAVRGDVSARTSGGTIRVDKSSGSVTATTSGGSIRIGEAGGAVEARTSGGNIAIVRSGADIVAKTSGGSISIDAGGGRLDAKTSGGSITARMTTAPRESWSLATSGGSIRLAVPGTARFDLDAKTSGGRVTSNVPVTVQGELRKNLLQGAVNGGGPRVVLRTSGGGISIERQ
ncbi:MAG TPA: DUF4097 family beta strand repeat-containing protein [Thermoanaerobaculia bacterium]|nr:DUF4097 family beta strand repeat-containing protein [Thermoanaerobaculia bacterium]